MDQYGVISTFAGNGTIGSSGDSGLATAASLGLPEGIAVDSVGNVFIADLLQNNVRKVDVGGIITTVAGNGSSTFAGDGIPAIGAQINPGRVVIGPNGDLYIADWYNRRVFQVGSDGIIHSIVGNGISGFLGDNGPATAAELNYTAGLSFDLCGNLYLTDVNNRRIRKVTYAAPPTIVLTAPSSASVGASVSVSATVANVGTGYVIKWLNHGVIFATTTTPSVSYIKAFGIDTITAFVYGCGDTGTSAVYLVTTDYTGTTAIHSSTGGGAVIGLWPNPVNTSLHVSTATAGVYRVTSVLGMQFLKGTMQIGENLVLLGELPAGFYFLEFVGADGVKVVCRFVKT